MTILGANRESISDAVMFVMSIFTQKLVLSVQSSIIHNSQKSGINLDEWINKTIYIYSWSIIQPQRRNEAPIENG